MVKRTVNPSVAFQRNFNHVVTFKFGTNIKKWSGWLEDKYGPAPKHLTELYKDRWCIYGRKAGFKRSDDLEEFVKAAKEYLLDELCFR